MRIVEKRPKNYNEEDEFDYNFGENETIIMEGPYCLCRGPDDGSPMICCDKCNEWYHIRCIQISARLARSLEKYFCPKCDETFNDKLFSTYSNNNNNNRLYKNEEDEEYSEEMFDYYSDNDDDKFQNNKISQFSQYKKDKKRKGEISLKDSNNKKIKENIELTRKKVQESLVNALKLINQEQENIDISIITNIACQIEKELFNLFHNTGREYKMKFRTLWFNLKDIKNQQLRKKVLTGVISPNKLCQMDSKDLANKELAEYRKTRDEKYLENVVIKEDHLPPSLLIKKNEISPVHSKKDSSITPLDLGEKIRPITNTVTTNTEISSPISTTTTTSTITTISTTSPSSLSSNNESIQNQLVKSTSPSILDNTIPLKLNELNDIVDPNIDEINSSPFEGGELVSETKPFLTENIEIPSFSEFAEKDNKINNNINSNDDINNIEKEMKNNYVEDTKLSSSPSIKKFIWSGCIKTTNCKFQAKAVYVNGSHIEKHLSSTFMQVGRMDLDALLKYVSQIPFSSSRNLSVLYFLPNSEEDKKEYVSTFENLKSSHRGAVIKASGNFIKEIFIIPISMDTLIPTWAQEFHPEENTLLGIFIYSKSSSHKKQNKEKKKNKSDHSNKNHTSSSPNSISSPHISNQNSVILSNTPNLYSSNNFNLNYLPPQPSNVSSPTNLFNPSYLPNISQPNFGFNQNLSFNNNLTSLNTSFNKNLPVINPSLFNKNLSFIPNNHNSSSSISNNKKSILNYQQQQQQQQQQSQLNFDPQILTQLQQFIGQNNTKSSIIDKTTSNDPRSQNKSYKQSSTTGNK